jgi:phosphoglycolate phosphatase
MKSNYVVLCLSKVKRVFKVIKLVVFDLDGTVCNTIDDLAAATNHALSGLGYPTHQVEAYKYFVGNGMYNLALRALPQDKQHLAQQVKEMLLQYYSTHFADKSKPYDGIIPMLNKLKKQGIYIAICTNKAHYMAEKIANEIFGGIFHMVVGQGDKYPLKPNPSSTEEIMNYFKASKEETVFVGDSGVDMQTALGAGVTSIGVLWGFRGEEELKENGAQHIAATPNEIIDIINKL